MDGAPGPVLQSVVVRGCLLTGGVPASLSQLPRLEYLDLSGNHLDGGLAPEWDGASMRLVGGLSYLSVRNAVPDTGRQGVVYLGATSAPCTACLAPPPQLYDTQHPCVGAKQRQREMPKTLVE